MDALTAEAVSVSKLAGMGAPYNPRKIDDRQLSALRKSLRTFGAVEPVVANKRSGLVVGGHQRIKAAQAEGIATLPVVWVDLDPTQERQLNLALNRISGEWDEPALAALLDEMGAAAGDLTGFDTAEIDELVDRMKREARAVDPEDVPEPPVEPRTKRGDLWLMGNHRLLCGDSTSAEDVARLMGGEKADICFTSPPYGAGNVAKLRDHYEKGAAHRESFYVSHADDPESWPALMDGWFAAVRPVVAAVVVNVQMLADNKRHMVRWVGDRVDDLVDVIIWDKVNAAPQMQRGVLSNAFEFVFVFGGNGSRAIPFSEFHGTVSNVVRIDPRKCGNENAGSHRAVMPVALPAWVMGTLCPTATSVVDPFTGTGTTIVAAEQIGRRCYGMEIEPKYCDVTVERWENVTGKKAILEAAP